MEHTADERFRKKLRRLPELSSLAVDLHSHLIPGIDDGVKTTEEAIRLIRLLHAMGYRKLITTPHINDRYRNTPGIIMAGLDKLRNAVAEAEIEITIDAAAEYKLNDDFLSLAKQGELLTFGNNHILLELDYHFPDPRFSQTIYELQSAGYNVVLAHVERYTYWHRKLEEFEKLKAREVMLQVNFMSLGFFNPPAVHKTVKMLIDAGMVDFAGTDVHNEMYMKLALLGMRTRYAHKLVTSGQLRHTELR